MLRIMVGFREKTTSLSDVTSLSFSSGPRRRKRTRRRKCHDNNDTKKRREEEAVEPVQAEEVVRCYKLLTHKIKNS